MIVKMEYDKSLILGTALWGWGVSKKGAWAILDEYFESGHKDIDTAINYPINKVKEDFGKAVCWLSEWVKANQNSGSRIILKIGAKDNLGSLDTNLSKSSILAAFSEGKEKFGDNLKCISIHWDNRGKDELRYIHESLSALKNINDMGVVIGLSGILNPKLYQGKVSDFKGNLKIQVKENISTRAARIKYAKYFPHAEYCSYGANMGGIKKNNQEKGSSVALRGISTSAKLLNKIDKFIDVEIPKGIHIRNYNDLAMYFSSINPHLWGTIIGPRNKEQLIDTLSIWKAVRSYNNLVEPKLMYSKFIDYFEPAS